MKSIILILFFILSAIFTKAQDSKTVEFSITDSCVYLDHHKISDTATIFFFTSHFGKPERTKKETKKSLDNKTKSTWELYIYDVLGFVVTCDKETKRLVAIDFNYLPNLYDGPKESFNGIFYVDGISILQTDNPNSLQEKLPSYGFAGMLGFCVFTKAPISFTASFLPRNDTFFGVGYVFKKYK